MPGKAKDESGSQHAKRSWRKTRAIINGGEPNPIEADDALDAMVRRSIRDHGA